MLNLVGLVVYGAANFALVGVVTIRLGAQGAGQFLIAVGVYTIGQKLAEFGAVTGLVRFIARFRAMETTADIRPVIRIALVPVLVMGTLVAATIFLAAGPLSRLFSDPADADQVRTVLRSMAPFLVVSPAYAVMMQATRGFDAMLPSVALERLGRACSQPIAAFIVISAGGDSQAVGISWAAGYLVFLVPAALWLRKFVRATPTGGTPRKTRPLAEEFWRFTLPRSGGALFEVGILWADTLVVGAIAGTEAAGIYAAGSRFLLLAVYVVDALIQVVGPRLSGLLATHSHDDASEVLSTAAGWHMMLVWPVYLLVFVFASVFLGVLGDEFIAAEPALRWLCAAALAASIHGPSVSVILMGGKSSVALANTAVAFVVNLGGNLLLVGRYGIAGAGFTWGLTILLTSSLPAIESAVLFDVRPWRRHTLWVPVAAAATVGLAALASRLILGDTLAALSAALITGGIAYVLVIQRRADDLRLRELVGRRTVVVRGAT